MIKAFVATAVVLGGITILAQNAPTADSKPQLPWVAAPSAEIQRLSSALVGTWTTSEKFEPNQFLKSRAAGAGTFSIRKGPGGNSLFLDYRSLSSMGPYSSRRVIYWNNREHQYHAFYCDSLQSTGCGEAGTGRWEGKDLVFESMTQGPAGLLKVIQRFSDISDAGFTFSLDLIDQGKRERSLTIEARKKGVTATAIPLGGTTAVVQRTATPDSKSQLQWVAAQVPEVQSLSDAFVGQWTTLERFEPDESHKNGAKGTGAFSIRKGPGGNSLILDYTSRSTMGAYSSSRIIYWESREGKYHAFYCDSLQPTGCGEAGSGKWEGKNLTFESMIHESGSTVPITERFSDISGKGFAFSLDFVNHGKTERSLTIEAHKTRGRP